MAHEVIEKTVRDLAVQGVKPELARPRMYKVILINDDYTPMEFVVEILRAFFFMDEVKATQIMLEVHQKGKAVCGVFTRDVAETKVVQVNEFSKKFEHPLLCDLEPVEI